MKRYFFDLSDGTQERDNSGTEFPTERAAHREAIRYVGEILKHEPDRLEHGALRVNVTDEDRKGRFAVEVRLEPGSANRPD